MTIDDNWRQLLLPFKMILTIEKTILETSDIWGIENSDNWEPEFMTIFVTWQLIVTLDSIRNSCDVFTLFSNSHRLRLTFYFFFKVLNPHTPKRYRVFWTNSTQFAYNFSFSCFAFFFSAFSSLFPFKAQLRTSHLSYLQLIKASAQNCIAVLW